MGPYFSARHYTALLLTAVLSVRLSVTLVIHVYKRFKISKRLLHHTIERCFWFLEANFHCREFRGSP